MDDMRSFEHRIAGELGRMAGPEPPVDALVVARSVAAQAPKRRFQTMFSALKFVAAAVVLAMFSGFLYVSLQQDPNQPPVVGTSPSAEISAEPTTESTADPATAEPTPSDVTTSESLIFDRLDSPGGSKSFQNGIAALPTGEILVVGSRPGPDGLISAGWLSTDGGRTWTRNDLGMPKDEHQANDVIEWDGGFVVVGTLTGGAIRTGYVVMSPDGVAWSEPSLLKKASFYRVQANQDGLLIRGHEQQGRICGGNSSRQCLEYAEHPAVFTSPNGVDLEMHRVETAYVRQEASVESGKLLTGGAARSNSGIWIVPGEHQTGGIPGFIEVKDPTKFDQSEIQGLLWRSDDDGASWTPLDLPIKPQPGELISPRAIAWTPAGFVLALAGFGQPGSIWHSEDGLSWVRVADTGQTWVESFVDDGQRLVAFTGPAVVPSDAGPEWADQLTPVFQSADGRTWTATLVAEFDTDIVDRATVSSNGRIVALGRDLEPGPLFGPDGPIEFPGLVWVGDPS